MSDFSNIYSVNKNSEIIIAKNNVFVKFKPFIESFGVELKNNSLTVKGVDTISMNTTSTKERRYKLSFNVPSLGQSDSRENHKKFQKLLRMCMPDDSSRTNSFYIKFANMIKKDVGSDVVADEDPYKNFIKSLGVNCKVSSLNYAPDMDSGFFDAAGMFFAKNFKIDLDLEILPGSYPRKKKYTKEKIKAGKDLIKPGNLYGFEVNYNTESEE